MKKTVILWLIVAIVVIGGIWWGISKKSAPATKETIKIGAILPLTGKSAQYGQWAKNGFDLAVEEINSLLDYSYRLELIYEDDAGDSKTSVSAMQKILSTYHPSVIVGAILSSPALSIAPLAEQNHVVLLSTSASSDTIRNAGDYIFRVRESGITHGQSVAGYIFNHLGIKNAGSLYLNAENGITYANAFKERFLQLGGEVSFYETYDEGNNDFRTQLLKAKNDNIKMLYVPGLVTGIGSILKQAKEMKLEIKFFSSPGAENPKLIEISGDAAENLIYTYPAFDPDSSDETIKQFTAKYLEKFGIKPEFIAANSYDAIKILAQIFKQYGSSPDQIKNGLYQTKDYHGVGGNLSFDEYGDVVKSVMFKTIKNGQFVPYEDKQ